MKEITQSVQETRENEESIVSEPTVDEEVSTSGARSNRKGMLPSSNKEKFFVPKIKYVTLKTTTIFPDT